MARDLAQFRGVYNSPFCEAGERLSPGETAALLVAIEALEEFNRLRLGRS